MKKIMKKILTIIILILAIFAIGWVGELDYDEYIEVNSTPVSRMPYWYEN